jgi:hypothetical protein
MSTHITDDDDNEILEINFNRKELSEIFVLGKDGVTWKFKSPAYINVIKSKLIAVTGVKKMSVSDTLKTSGRGDSALKKVYFVCNHGINKKTADLKAPRYNRKCKLSISCKASSFHPNQDSLTFQVKNNKCSKCLCKTIDNPRKRETSTS